MTSSTYRDLEDQALHWGLSAGMFAGVLIGAAACWWSPWALLGAITYPTYAFARATWRLRP